MQKLARASLSYMIIGLISGVYFREMTKFNDFDGWTQLSVVHTHTLILGMFFFLIVLLLEKNFNLTKHKNFKKFYITYNIGLGVTLLMLLTHGTMTVLGIESSAAISGIAGLGHVILTIGLGFFFQVLLQSIKKD
ncbi:MULTISPECIES: DUF2871 domain-containing protein [Enterococcaceae]|uniref:DUF2871 domain-containing protein n=1 Tax=Enterococcaceae TaxID=81852 RepID=UPI000E4EB5D6|nr:MULTISPECIES: DUF2871 domain-containing protein [Enterococcaceae]MCI0131032.1 DUF2871 domain-containing protein [Vagococcus sp. CY53-2]RGI29343.1 DUF2871 domain-containing protein [Melissococcus sp. OM08-11BH]UNM89394.1 DUF2871 domain-containing protein [Vagococcus sp. CY52-2]